jgi:hypothetical protein
MAAIQPHALRHMGIPSYVTPAKSLRRYSNLPSRFSQPKTRRRFRFHPLKLGYLLGTPSKKLRLLYARQRRPNQFIHRKSASRSIHERWSNCSTLLYYFSAWRAHWYVDNRDGTYSMKEAGAAWAENLSRFRVAERVRA